MRQPISSLSPLAFQGTPLPEFEAPKGIRIWHVLSLANLKSGIVPTSDGGRISIPFTVEHRGGSFLLRSHFPAFRTGLADQIRKQGRIEVLFDLGEYYIDPEWVLRPNHAPTEVKLLFTVEGTAAFVEASADDAIDHLDRVTGYRQALNRPNSAFSVRDLPEAYYADQLPQILHIEVAIERIRVTQAMALLHLIPEHRQHVLDRLDELDDAHSKLAGLILRVFP